MRVRAAIVVVAATALALFAAAPASAHNYVVDSTPAEGETLGDLPDEFSVTTNERLLEEGASALYARDADGLYYGDGCTTVSGATLSASAAIGGAGDYTLVYQFVSADGHTVSGEIPFTWEPDGAQPSTTGTAEPTRCVGTPGEPGAGATIDPDALWIAGAIGAVVVAIAITLPIAIRRRRGAPESSRDPGGSSGG